MKKRQNKNKDTKNLGKVNFFKNSYFVNEILRDQKQTINYQRLYSYLFL